MRSLVRSYEFLPDGADTTYSLGSTSETWMERNFDAEHSHHMAETAYVTSNPFSSEYLGENDFYLLDEVWRYGWDDDLGTVPARNVTDRAILTAREEDPDRLLVHYMQPHFPSVPRPIGAKMDLDSFGEDWDSVWHQLKLGKMKKAVVWSSYRENLRYVLNEVSLLLRNVDASRVVISADHGNAFGEWGQFGHPPGVPTGALREVPWIHTSGTDTGAYSPSLGREDKQVDSDQVRSRLESLGYL